MKECIDREATMNSVNEEFKNNPNKAIRALLAIKSVPTVDVVEVIRCKDCKRYGKENCFMKIQMLWELRPDDYCSYAERRNDG